MTKDKKFLYAGGLGAVALLLVTTGAPPIFLILLACPLMMLFMNHGANHNNEK